MSCSGLITFALFQSHLVSNSENQQIVITVITPGNDDWAKPLKSTLLMKVGNVPLASLSPTCTYFSSLASDNGTTWNFLSFSNVEKNRQINFFSLRNKYNAVQLMLSDHNSSWLVNLVSNWKHKWIVVASYSVLFFRDFFGDPGDWLAEVERLLTPLLTTLVQKSKKYLLKIAEISS